MASILENYIRTINNENRIELIYTVLERLVRCKLYLYISGYQGDGSPIYNFIFLQDERYLPIFTSIKHLYSTTGKRSLYMELNYTHILSVLKLGYAGILLNPESNHSLAIDSAMIKSVWSPDIEAQNIQIVKGKICIKEILIRVRKIGDHFKEIVEIIPSTLMTDGEQYTHLFMILLERKAIKDMILRNEICAHFQKLIFDNFKQFGEYIILYDSKPLLLLKENAIANNIVKNILPAYVN
jgi:hypothetical protein